MKRHFRTKPIDIGQLKDGIILLLIAIAALSALGQKADICSAKVHVR
jgi:hypothetical protein